VLRFENDRAWRRLTIVGADANASLAIVGAVPAPLNEVFDGALTTALNAGLKQLPNSLLRGRS
jgi:hypothetical protein